MGTRRHTLMVVLVLSAGMATLASCAGVGSWWQGCDIEVAPDTYVGVAAEGESSSTTYCLNVSGSADPVTIRMVYRLTGGALTWSLKDPYGREWWKGGEAGFVSGEGSVQLRAVAGSWLLRAVASDLEGGYYLIWTQGQ